LFSDHIASWKEGKKKKKKKEQKVKKQMKRGKNGETGRGDGFARTVNPPDQRKKKSSPIPSPRAGAKEGKRKGGGRIFPAILYGKKERAGEKRETGPSLWQERKKRREGRANDLYDATQKKIGSEMSVWPNSAARQKKKKKKKRKKREEAPLPPRHALDPDNRKEKVKRVSLFFRFGGKRKSREMNLVRERATPIDAFTREKKKSTGPIYSPRQRKIRELVGYIYLVNVAALKKKKRKKGK